jgi:NAD(P)-dependent dehydrogenase (short-subunit alcohol dehydrogenase family)
MPNDESFLEDRYVMLTGVGRPGQTGEIIAREFARRGARMILVDRQISTASDRASDLASEGYVAHPFGCDLASEADIASLAEQVQELCGKRGLAALINAAGGFAMSGNVAESNLADWEKQFTINLRTCYLASRAMLPLLRTGRGAIVNFATGAALQPKGAPGMSAYLAAKSGVVALTRTMAMEERDTGVRVNAIAPTAIRTAANANTMSDKTRFVERESVASTLLFLCSPEASAISGEIILLA